MRRSLITILFMTMLVASFAQNSKKKYGFGAGFGFVDFSGPITDQYLMLNNSTGALNLSFGQYFSKSFDGRLNMTYSNIWHPFVTNYPNQIEGLYSQATMWDLGFNLMLKLNNGSLLKEDSRIAPYLFTGLGANMINGIGNVGVNDDINTYIPVGIGMNVRINDDWTIGLDGAYKFNLDNSYNYTQSTLKLIRNFGNRKTADAAATATSEAAKTETSAASTSAATPAAVATTAAPTTPPVNESFCAHRTSIYAGVGFVDFQTPITGQPFMFDRYKAVLNIGVQQYLSKFFDGRLNFVYGNVWHPFETAYPNVIEGLMVPATMYELGVDFMFKFNNGSILKENAIFAPYVFAGLSVQSLMGIGNAGVSDDINTNIPLGLGFNFRTSDRFTLGIEGAYKFNIDNSYDYVGAGIRGIYHLGKCIDGTKAESTPAAKAAAKVDDADGDGIADLTDECPFVAGKVEFFGCPDSDGDGIGDSRDKCPFEAGAVANQGCPGKALETVEVNADDTDKDGINNNDDLCPDEAGPASNNGCPVSGENTSLEVKSSTETTKTPLTTTTTTTTNTTTSTTTKTPVAGNVTMKDKSTSNASTSTTTTREPLKYVPPTDNTKQNLVNSYTIYFTSGNNIAPGQIESLQAIANLLRNNPNYSVRLNGHTAKGGSSERNMDLSITRAEKVMGTLRMKGVDMKRTRLVGYGDERTRFTGSESGKNNRVEVEVYSFE